MFEIIEFLLILICECICKKNVKLYVSNCVCIYVLRLIEKKLIYWYVYWYVYLYIFINFYNYSQK